MNLEQSIRRVEKILHETDPAPYRIDFIHGLVTAAAIGPAPLKPRDWLQVILARDEEPEIPPSPEEVNKVISSLLDLYNHNILALERQTYSPLFEVIEKGETEEDTVYSAKAFCTGFVTGMRLWDIDWDNVDEELLDMVTPLIYLSDPENVGTNLSPKSREIAGEIEENLMESVLVHIYRLYERHVATDPSKPSAPFE